MNKFITIIEKLCHKDVKFVKIGTVCTVVKGTQLNKEKMLNAGNYPVINGGIHASGF
jgi:type I restriction enzyme S subunit